MAIWTWGLLAVPGALPCLCPCSLWDVPEELQHPWAAQGTGASMPS